MLRHSVRVIRGRLITDPEQKKAYWIAMLATERGLYLVDPVRELANLGDPTVLPVFEGMERELETSKREREAWLKAPWTEPRDRAEWHKRNRLNAVEKDIRRAKEKIRLLAGRNHVPVLAKVARGQLISKDFDKDNRRELRTWAIRRLGEIRTKEAIEVLIQIVDEWDRYYVKLRSMASDRRTAVDLFTLDGTDDYMYEVLRVLKEECGRDLARERPIAAWRSLVRLR